MKVFSSALAALLLIVCQGLGAEGMAEDPSVIPGFPSVSLFDVIISRVSPLNVLPGTLVSVEGEGFGTKAGVLRIGNQTISEFLEWSETAIFFRIPKAGLSSPDAVQIGNAYSEGILTPAPVESLTLLITIDMEALKKKASAEWQTVYKASTLPLFTPPMFVKGEWVKGDGVYGNNAIGTWDNGSKVRMLRDKTGTKWFAEVVFTPENIKSFGGKAMKFAFEDGNDGERNLSPYESDIAFILKKDWAAHDAFTTIHTDPAVYPATKDKAYADSAKSILLTYPPKK